MSYEKHNFKPDQILKSEHMNEIENGQDGLGIQESTDGHAYNRGVYDYLEVTSSDFVNKMKIGDKKVVDMKIGNKTVSKLYLGDELIYESKFI